MATWCCRCVFHLACMTAWNPKPFGRKRQKVNSTFKMVLQKSIADLRGITHTRLWELHASGLSSRAATPAQILLYLFRLESEDICCSAAVTARQTNFKVNHIYSYGSNLFPAESVTKLLRKFQAQFNPNWLPEHEHFLSKLWVCLVSLVQLVKLFCHHGTVDVLDIHRGLGLQQQRQQLRGARQSSMVQRWEAVGERERRIEGRKGEGGVFKGEQEGEETRWWEGL